jgi:S-DNA-T family DNA segregation ATPase FtsK/SpoIIIE
MDIEVTNDEHAKSLVEQFGTYDHKLDLASYKYPLLELLEIYDTGMSITADEINNDKQIILDTLNYSQVGITSIKATIGPRVILYEVIPAPGVRITQVVNMEADIALRLGKDAKITGAIVGKGTIGIEVPHLYPMLLSIRSVLATEKFMGTDMVLPLVLGKTMDNEVLILDLAKLPHLLIAGSTGQGKSIAINTMLASLLYKKHPAELKLVLINITKLELGPFWRIERHFLAKLPDEANAIVTELHAAINTLSSLYLELDQRYELLKTPVYATFRSITKNLLTAR